MNLAPVEIKAFVPAFDFNESKAFYQALGFDMTWSSDALAYLRHGHASFLLQAFYVRKHVENFMMHLQVENVDDWHAHVRASNVQARFGVKVGEPADQPWGMRDFTLCRAGTRPPDREGGTRGRRGRAAVAQCTTLHRSLRTAGE